MVPPQPPPQPTTNKLIIKADRFLFRGKVQNNINSNFVSEIYDGIYFIFAILKTEIFLFSFPIFLVL